MAYTAEKPKTAPDSDELRRRIPGWGVDLDPAVRMVAPKEDRRLRPEGAHWEFPERQPERWPRERSTEHKFLTPVFGTAQPLRGISGAIRRFAYDTFSEGQSAHWLLLMLGDRVDVLESRVEALLQGRPDNPLTETGIAAEFRRGGMRTRFGQHRADLKHQPIDVLMFLAPYAAAAGGAGLLTRALTQGRRV